MDLKQFFRDFGEYYPSEKRGVVYLATIIAIWIAGLFIYSRIPPYIEEDREFEQAVASYYQQLQKEELKKDISASEAFSDASMFEFDPNTISADSLQLLGLKPFVARAIVNYRNSGGEFHKPEDLKRIYTLDEEVYEQIAPFIQISSRSYVVEDNYGGEYESGKSDGGEAEQISPVDINRADTAQLKQIPGIGSYYAREIVRNRKLFGGYRSLDQLLEIDLYMFDVEKLDEVAPYLNVDTANVERIDLNQVSLDELRLHPYFPYSVANSIVKMRDAHGPYQKVSDIKRSHLVNDSIFELVKPYLVIHD